MRALILLRLAAPSILETKLLKIFLALNWKGSKPWKYLSTGFLSLQQGLADPFFCPRRRRDIAAAAAMLLSLTTHFRVVFKIVRLIDTSPGFHCRKLGNAHSELACPCVKKCI